MTKLVRRQQRLSEPRIPQILLTTQLSYAENLSNMFANISHHVIKSRRHVSFSVRWNAPDFRSRLYTSLYLSVVNHVNPNLAPLQLWRIFANCMCCLFIFQQISHSHICTCMYIYELYCICYSFLAFCFRYIYINVHSNIYMFPPITHSKSPCAFPSNFACQLSRRTFSIFFFLFLFSLTFPKYLLVIYLFCTFIFPLVWEIFHIKNIFFCKKKFAFQATVKKKIKMKIDWHVEGWSWRSIGKYNEKETANETKLKFRS